MKLHVNLDFASFGSDLQQQTPTDI
jgi:hypothetical protein